MRTPFALCAGLVLFAPIAAARDVTLHWLDRAPADGAGVSFGVPWPRGEVHAGQVFSLRGGDRSALPLQSWTLAYWPDGSVKWTGFATVASRPGPLTLSTDGAGTPAPGVALTVRRFETGLEIDTGVLRCRLRNEGDEIISSLVVDGREVARHGQLVCIRQDGPDGEPQDGIRRIRCVGRIEHLTVEQDGPVRAVVKIEGRHVDADGRRAWLPFVVRLYFYAGRREVRVVHTIVYDGDEHRDFIHGLGLVFGVPLREEVQNRHVRFAGQGPGLWAEPVQPLVGLPGRVVADPKRPLNPIQLWAARSTHPGSDSRARGGDVYPDQLEGRRVPNRAQVDDLSRNYLTDWAVWSDFKLTQLSPDGFTVVKRTGSGGSWVQAGASGRAAGLVFAGDVSGGLAVGVRRFWESYPDSLEVRDAASPEASLQVWLWSPDAPSMDLRHYDTRSHGLDAVYEGSHTDYVTALGIARTSELTLYPTDRVPSRSDTVALAAEAREPAVLVPTPAYLHLAGVFGIWSLPDRSTPFKRAIEDDLDGAISLYEKAVDERRWYGFWYYGNIIHSYDDIRHAWRYDQGGMAWDNTELGTDMWLWYSFLRTGRADIFRMAEAMTRNTSEIDVYHLGPALGLGSRHNVTPWGGKEVRISQAAWKRFYYYLTTDERVGDLMREVLGVDAKMDEFDPMRTVQPRTAGEWKYPQRIRAGPDWLAFVGNWMTEWERTGDTRWRDKIEAGMDSLSAMPYRLRSGKNLVYGYDAKTGRLFRVSDEIGDYNLATIQGGAEVAFEVNPLVENAAWRKTWLQYCRLEDAPAAVVVRDNLTGAEGADGRYVGHQAGGARLGAYAYAQTGNPAFARRAIDLLLQGDNLYGRFGGLWPGMYSTRRVEGPSVLNPVDEAPAYIMTNDVAQSSLMAIEVLQLCADRLPYDFPPGPRRP